MKRAVFLLVILCVAPIWAQTEPKNVERAPTARKIAEFGPAGECSLGQQFDQFFVELQENPRARGHAIFYRGRDALPAARGQNPLETAFRNHIMFRGQDPNRFTVVSGGYRETATVEFYLVPAGAEAPAPSGTVAPPAIPDRETYLFDRRDLFETSSVVADDYVLPSVKAQQEAELAAAQSDAEEFADENPAEAATEETSEDSAPVEAPTEETGPTPEELEAERFAWISDGFAAAIKKQRGARGVLVFYADESHYDVARLRGLIEEGAQRLAEKQALAAGKVTVVFGGYRASVEIEFWVVPNKGRPPVPKPEEKTPEEPAAETPDASNVEQSVD